MPFEPIYAVDFAFGNLTPYINKYDWRWMEFTPVTPHNLAEWIKDESPIFRVTRPEAATAHARCSLFVRTPGLALSSRVRMQLRFKSPLGEGIAEDGQFYQSDISLPLGDPRPTAPEPWAVGLNVFSDVDLLTNPDPNADQNPDPNVTVSVEQTAVRVTCQFNRIQKAGGIRLNTPGSREDFVGEVNAQTVKPLQYGFLRRGGLTLEHSFCGVGAEATDHKYVVGSGYLSWNPPSPPAHMPLEDQRVFSSGAFHTLTPPNPIQALGFTLVTQTGTGRISFSPVSFVVWENKPYIATPTA